VPKTEAPNLSLATTASQVAKSVTDQTVGPASQPKNVLEDLPSILTVEVVGYEEPGDKDAPEKARRRR
jgi:hypothetical protein